MQYVILIKKDTQKNPFVCLLFKSKYGLQYIHWVGNLVVKLIDAGAYQKLKAIREGEYEERDNFEMDILAVG